MQRERHRLLLRKILDEKGDRFQNSKSGSGRDGRITKEDAVNATPSMGTPCARRSWFGTYQIIHA